MRCLSCGLILALTLSLAAARLGAADDADAGFTLLFNGKNLDGWKTKDGGKSLDGKTEAYDGRFKVSDGLLVIDPKVKGDKIIVSAKELGDAHIKFEFLPGVGCNNDLFFRGLKFDLKKEDVKNFKPGEWHTFEIVVAGDKAEFKCNGELQKTMKVKAGTKSGLGLRAELGPMQVRKLQVKEK